MLPSLAAAWLLLSATTVVRASIDVGVDVNLFGHGKHGVVEKTLVIKRGQVNPDGFSRDGFTMNGQTSGPLITANEGDTMLITIDNQSPESITMHWHGMQQAGTPWSDGVPGITQFPILPGHKFLYNFTAEPAGTHWFHSHSRQQLDDGLKGTLYIRPKASTPRPYKLISSNPAEVLKMTDAELRPLNLRVEDWRHGTAQHIHFEWERTKIETLCADSILLNGKGRGICPPQSVFNALPHLLPYNVSDKGCAFPNTTAFYPPFPATGEKPHLDVDPALWFTCKNTSSPLEVLRVDSHAGWAVMNIWNTGAVWDLRVAIDGHTMWVIAADGNYVQPQKVNTLLVTPGERNSVVIKLDQKPGDYTIRVAESGLPQFLTGYGVLSYGGYGGMVANAKQWLDYGGNPINNATDMNKFALAPFPSNAPTSTKADVFLKLKVSRPGAVEWTMNGVPYPIAKMNTSEPILLQPSAANALDPSLHPSYPLGSLVDIVFEIQDAGMPSLHPPHPMHKHGVKAFHLGSGTGPFPHASIDEAIAANDPAINIHNPPLRDQFPTPPGVQGKVWSAIRFRAVDAGPTFLHCHIDPHQDAGMAVVLLEGMDKLPPIPAYYANQPSTAK